MGVLDKVMQMRSQGRSESEIINSLRSQGIQPKEIQDALNQAQIKNAVAGHEDLQESIMNQNEEYTPYAQSPGYAPQEQEAPTPVPEYPTENYSPQQEYPAQPQEQSYPQETQQYYQPEQPQQGYYQDYYPQQEQFQESYPQENNNFVEVAEQVVSEKTKKMQTQMDSIIEFKNMAENYLKILEERIKRLEATMDQLQISILDKVGSYGKNLNMVKKEMEMMQDSFSKIVNPYLDRNPKK